MRKVNGMYLVEDFIEVCPCVDDENNLNEVKAMLEEKHVRDLQLVRQYATYYNQSLKTLGRRPSCWTVPKGYTYNFFKYKDLHLEVLEPKNSGKKVVLNVFGCAYVNHLSDALCNTMVQYSKVAGDATVITCDYRTAVDYSYKEILSDLVETYKWILKSECDPKDIVVFGDSSGGGSTMALIMYLRDHKMPLPGVVCVMSPWANIKQNTRSYIERKDIDCIMGKSNLLAYGTVKMNLKGNLYSPYCCPLLGSFKDFPRMLIQVGTDEMVLDDSIIIAKKAFREGVDVKLEIYEGMFHNFQQKHRLLKSAKVAWEKVSDFLNEE